MEMGPRRATGHADAADQLSPAHMSAFLDVDGVHMDVEGADSETVIDQHRLVGTDHTLMDQHHPTVRSGDDGRALGGCDIDPEMRPSFLAVEDALATIDAA